MEGETVPEEERAVGVLLWRRRRFRRREIRLGVSLCGMALVLERRR